MKTAFIIGKGQDDKELIHLHPATIKILKEYLHTNRIREGALFRSGSNFSSGSRLTTKSIREIIKKVLNDLNIDGSTHGFRHFFITKLIKSYKGELLTVSKYSRHRSIQMLEVYNDEIIREQDLPRFYNVFSDITL
ncbi:MAG: tyrosine-type recombinase/integrase [Prevotella sp.]|nr:tyrosine-type recombinase/integrase [Prevotella sp.]